MCGRVSYAELVKLGVMTVLIIKFQHRWAAMAEERIRNSE